MYNCILYAYSRYGYVHFPYSTATCFHPLTVSRYANIARTYLEVTSMINIILPQFTGEFIRYENKSKEYFLVFFFFAFISYNYSSLDTTPSVSQYQN